MNPSTRKGFGYIVLEMKPYAEGLHLVEDLFIELLIVYCFTIN